MVHFPASLASAPLVHLLGAAALLTTSFAPLAQPGPADALAAGAQAERRGEYVLAAEQYAAAADAGVDDPLAARLDQARAALLAGDSSGARQVLEPAVESAPNDATSLPPAIFLLGVARKADGDCPAAVEAFDVYLASGRASLAAYAQLQRAACFERAGDAAAQLQAANAALAVPGIARLVRVDALERAATALSRLGRKPEALDRYTQLLELAATRTYRSEMLYLTGALARDLGRDAVAIERFRAIVVEYPDLPRAPTALEHLTQLGQAGVISPLQAGLVRLNARDYEAAKALFAQVPASSPDAGAARFNHAVARLRSEGDDTAALAEMVALAESDRSWAGAALIRVARVYEQEDKPTNAEAMYQRLAQLDPSSDQLPAANTRLGILRYARGDMGGALAAFEAALDPARKPTAAAQAKAQLWRGKVLASQKGAASAEARSAWTRAAELLPDGYDGFRAMDLLAGRAVATAITATRPLSALDLSAPDAAALAEWMNAQLKSTPAALAAEVGADVNVARADELLALGLRDEATWELEPVAARYTQQKDVPRLWALADWAARRTLYDRTITYGRQARDLTGAGLLSLPKAVQREVYPAGWGDLVFAEAAKQQLDPLLLLGLVRQESSFTAAAVSSARATGLTQVTPGTGAEIARRLGRAGFNAEELKRPGVSLEFGAYYLSAQLSAFNGRILPALAAYNAGGGNAAAWLKAYGDDPDLFVERIPFSETQTYVRAVYENYRLYQSLYGG